MKKITIIAASLLILISFKELLPAEKTMISIQRKGSESFNVSLAKFSDSVMLKVREHNELVESQRTDSPYNQKHFDNKEKEPD